MRKTCSLRFDSQSDRKQTSAEITLRLVMVDATHQEGIVFDVVNLNAVKWPATVPFKDAPTVKMTINSSLGTTLKHMSNESIELTHRLVNSHEECFSQPNHDRLATVCAHPLFSVIEFDELKIMREDMGDVQELIKIAGQIFMDAMNKMAKEHSSLVGSETSDLSNEESIFEQNSIAPPSIRLNKLKKYSSVE